MKKITVKNPRLQAFLDSIDGPIEWFITAMIWIAVLLLWNHILTH